MEFYRSGNKEELAILRDTLIGKTELEAEKRKDEVKLTRNSVRLTRTKVAYRSSTINTRFTAKW